jgi:hypothetical protein
MWLDRKSLFAILLFVLAAVWATEDDRRNVISDDADDYDWKNGDPEAEEVAEPPVTMAPVAPSRPTKVRADPELEYEQNIYFKYFDG